MNVPDPERQVTKAVECIAHGIQLQMYSLQCTVALLLVAAGNGSDIPYICQRQPPVRRTMQSA